MRVDVVVLGAGIVGASVALHLQARGRAVALVDRRAPGEETSHGNAGLIERSSLVPYPFPREASRLLRYALNRSADGRYHLRHLPRIAPWLFAYWRHSAPERLAGAARDLLPLIERSLAEHEVLAGEAGIDAALRRTGWIKAFREPRTFADARAEAEALAPHGLRVEALDGPGLRAREPSLSERLIGGLHWLDPATVADPGSVVKAYADLLIRRGGRVLEGDARTLAPEGMGWSVRGEGGAVQARDAVAALGPWSDAILSPLGYRLPLAVKRGYHMHYAPRDGAALHRPVLDADGGVLLAPMARGIRLTTGVELASRDAPPTPVQLDRAEPRAREIFPLGERLDPSPWLGSRPCLPDMRPVIGPAPRHPGLWFAFGHNHHGFTLGPVTGRLLAELMTGEAPFADARPFRADRF